MGSDQLRLAVWHDGDEIFGEGVAACLGSHTDGITLFRLPPSRPQLNDVDVVVTLASALVRDPKQALELAAAIPLVALGRRTRSESRRIMALGCRALLAETERPDRLLAACIAVAAGYFVTPADIFLQARREQPPRVLTADEAAILRKVALAPRAAVARSIGYSERHAQRILRRLYDQLGIVNDRHAIRVAVAWGLISADGSDLSGS